MEAHIQAERKLKSEIARKNRLRKSMEKEISKVSRLTDKLLKTKNYRWQSKCLSSIERLGEKIDNMRQELVRLDQQLLEKIKQQMDFSVKEMDDYREKFKRECKQMLESHKMEVGAYNDLLKNYEWVFKIKKWLKLPLKPVKKRKRAPDEEAEVKEIFKTELREIIKELEILSSK